MVIWELAGGSEKSTHKWNKSLCNYWGAGGPNEKFWPQCGAEDAIQGFVHAKQTLYQMKGIPRPLRVLSEFFLPLPSKERLQLCTYPGLSKSGVHMAGASGGWRATSFPALSTEEYYQF